MASLAGRLKDKLLVPWFVRASFGNVQRRLDRLERRLELLQEALGRVESRQARSLDPVPDGAANSTLRPGEALRPHEFRVFSQWGEDGIIRHLVDTVPVPRPLFVEIGVERYEEANTRFLLVDRNWSGLVIDGKPSHVAHIRQSRIYWLHNLKAVEAFVTRENVDDLLRDAGVTGEIGLLSLDIDGMDYWVFEALEAVRPAIVVLEYNHRFGAEAEVTVPYDPGFDRRRAHHSLVYFGASLAALASLAARKGYDLVGCGRAGVNAFFVRRDLRPAHLPALTAAEAFVPGGFSEYHDAEGRRARMSPAEESRLALSLPLVDVSTPPAVPAAQEPQP
ncbi:MAG: hypothetical protein R6X25_14235 [Candidatus Krumholzibacteriia bacterium]